MRRASRQSPKRITQTVRGHPEQLEYARVASELRQHRDTVHRRRHRHHCRDAAILGGDANDMTAGEGDPPQHDALGIDAGQLARGGDCRVIVLALA